MEKLSLKPREAAEALGVGRTLFYRPVKANATPSCHIGKSVRSPVAALKAGAGSQGTQVGAAIKPSPP